MGLRVLSLFDGIACGMQAFKELGIPIDAYYASEIEPNAIKVAKANHPEIIEIGDVTKIDFEDYFGKVDMIIGGSPCQDLCCCGSRRGLQGDKSSLFYYFVDALEIIKPKFWMLENNASMTKNNKNTITQILGGVEPIMINSNLLSAQDRKRLYWCNFTVAHPCDKHITLQDILQPTFDKQQFDITNRMYAKKKGTLAYHKAWTQIRRPHEKMRCLTTSMSIANSGATNIMYDDGRIFMPTPLECERAQTLPDNYTNIDGMSNTQRYKMIGNGWTVSVIAHIFSFIPKEDYCEDGERIIYE